MQAAYTAGQNKGEQPVIIDKSAEITWADDDGGSAQENQGEKG